MIRRFILTSLCRHRCCVLTCGRYTEPPDHHNTTSHMIRNWQNDPRPFLKLDYEVHDFEGKVAMTVSLIDIHSALVHREGAYAKGRTWVSLPNRKTAVRARQRSSSHWWKQCLYPEEEEDTHPETPRPTLIAPSVKLQQARQSFARPHNNGDSHHHHHRSRSESEVISPHYTYFLAPPASSEFHIPNPSVPAQSIAQPLGSFVHQWGEPSSKAGKKVKHFSSQDLIRSRR
jgi:hypothetical protein